MCSPAPAITPSNNQHNNSDFQEVKVIFFIYAIQILITASFKKVGEFSLRIKTFKNFQRNTTYQLVFTIGLKAVFIKWVDKF